ncbi:MAG: GNAT family N-acetyltransferase [Treponema sp.]|nr:GNAT family N-acetyltransferase [Treponema sp.]
MEDQTCVYCFDVEQGLVVERDCPDHTRFYAIPEWKASDGYRTMQRFTVYLRNQIVQNKLVTALKREKGVFKAFKTCISQYPEIEKKWLHFKRSVMHSLIIDWYYAIKEQEYEEHIGVEPDETPDLLAEDFRFFTEQLSVVSETNAGDYVGHLTAHCEGEQLVIDTLEVSQRYRGLGIGGELLNRFLAQVESVVSITLPQSTEWFSRILIRHGFEAVNITYRRDTYKM